MPAPNQIVAPGEGRMPTTQTRKKPAGKPVQYLPDLTPKAQPDPILAKHGVFDPPQAVAEKVKAIKAAHQAHFGTPATAGHVYDVVRSNVPTEDIPKLYDALPRSKRQARVRAIPSPDTQDRLAGQDPADAVAPDPNVQIIADVKRATLDGNWDTWVKDNEKLLKEADQKLRQRIALAKNQADIERAKGSLAVAATKRGGVLPVTQQNLDAVQKAGIDPSVAFGPAWGAFNQIMTSLALGIPYLAIAEGKATFDTVTGRNPKALYETNKKLVKQAGVGFYEDFTNPKDNAGYLALDIFGLGSLAFGVVARAGAVGRASGVGAKTRAAFSKPLAGTRTAKFGDLEVELLNSENPMVRAGQKAVTNRANKKRAERGDTHFIPDKFSPTFSAGEQFLAPNRFWERFVSQEARAKGKLASDRRVDLALRDMSRKDLENVTGWAKRYEFTRSRLPRKLRRGLTRGEQAALLIESIDDPGSFQDRAAMMKDFHERQIQYGIGDQAAHEQRIRDVNAALKAYSKPSERFAEALDLTRKAVGEMEALKKEYGLTDETAARRVAQFANVIRGNPLTRESALSELWRLRDSLRKGRGDAGVISDRIAELKGKLADLPSDIGRAGKRLDDLAVRLGRETDPQKRAALERKIERARENLDKSIGDLADVQQLRDDSFYFPIELDTKVKRSPKNLFRGTRQGANGVAYRDPWKTLGLDFQFTGTSLKLGNYKVDTSRLVGAALGRTIRGVALIEEYNKLVKASSPHRRSRWDVPIRLPGTRGVPDKLREILDTNHGSEITAAEAEGLSKADWDATVKELFRATYNERKRQWEIDTEADNGEFAWVDSRLLGVDSSLAPASNVVQNIGRIVNTPFRAATLYARPAYWANLVGSAGMALWHQGVLTGPNVISALRYRSDVKDALRELVGAGRTASYIPGDNMATRIEKGAAHAWNTITDRDLRVSSLIHYLRKADVRGEEATAELLRKYRAGDEQAVKTLNAAVLQAKKSMVEFDNLSWFEKEYLRQFIFIYPWMKGSAMWNIKAIVDRPAQSAVVAQFGDDAQDYILEEGGQDMLAWFKKTGFFPMFWNGDNPQSVNFNGINTLASLSQLVANSGDANAYRQFGGPLTDFLIGAVTGRDQFGNQYERTGIGGNLVSSLLENFLALPQVGAYERAKKAGEQGPLPGIEIADRATLVRRRNAALEQVVLSPGWSLKLSFLSGIPYLDNIPGQLLVGGAFNPREVNKMAVLARAYKNLPPEEKRAAERELFVTALGMQADALGRKVPADVKKAVETHFDIETYVDQVRKDAGGDLTPLGTYQAKFDYLVSKDIVSQAEADVEMKALKRNLPNIDSLGPDAIKKYVDPSQSLEKWDQDITTLAHASDPQALDVMVRRLREDGGGTFDSPKGLKVNDLRAYGKQVAEYARKVSDLEEISGNKNLPAADRAAAEREIMRLEDENDKPVVIAGRSLPSVSRLTWAGKDDASRAQALASNAKQSWSSLSSFEKELLGKKPSPNMNTAWAQFNKLVDDYGNTHASTPQYVKDYYAKYVAKYYDGFKDDYFFSQQKLAVRLSYLKPIQQSPYRDKWNKILDVAKKKIAEVKAGYPSGTMNTYWKKDVVPVLIQYIQQDPGFDAEVKRYGYDILNGLLEG